MVLAAHTLKQIQHLQAIDKGSSSPSKRSSKILGRITKFHKAYLASPFLHQKSEHLTEKHKFLWFCSSTQPIQRMKNGGDCEITGGAPKILLSLPCSEHGDNKYFIAPKIGEVQLAQHKHCGITLTSKYFSCQTHFSMTLMMNQISCCWNTKNHYCSIFPTLENTKRHLN